MASDVEKQLMIREFREMCGGRFNSEETRRLFEHVNWDKAAAVNFMMENEPPDVRRITNMSEDTVITIKEDAEVLEAFQNGVKSVVRQFACQDCDNVWWFRVPLRKQVSKCKICKKKYDPVPTDQEWGWATFDCTYCGHTFSAYGEMNVTVCQCYQCKRDVVYPTRIIRPNRSRGQGGRRTGNRHSCEAQNCPNRHGHHDNAHENDQVRVYDNDDDAEEETDGNGGARRGAEQGNIPNIAARVANINLNTGQHRRRNFVCLSPQSGTMRKKVLHPSQIHQSTGSTVGTFLPQDDIASTYVPSLPSIKEVRRQEDVDRGGRGGRR